MVSTDLNSRTHSGKCTEVRRGFALLKKTFRIKKGMYIII